jgi:hypothetical protein
VAKARRIGTGIRNGVGVDSQGIAQGVAHFLPREGPLASHVEDFTRGYLGLARREKGRHQVLNVAKAERPRRTGRHWQKPSRHPPGDPQDAAVSGTIHDGGTQHRDVQAISHTENGRLTLQFAPPVGGNRMGRDVLGTCRRHQRGAHSGKATQVDEASWSPRCFQTGVDQMSSSLTIDAKNSRAARARVNPARW